MKIISVRFLNLNSINGEHIINFDQAPFNESGLFAITGPTGSGKTTLRPSDWSQYLYCR